MRRVFENSVKTAHSTSIARPCDGGVSELFRSCFCALALGFPPTAGAPEQVFRPAYFRPAGSKRTAFRFASLTLRLRPVRAWPARGSGRLIGPLGQTHGLQVRFAHPPTSPRAGKARPGFRMAYFRPAGSKRACSRFASLTLRLRPARATPARGSAWLIFALRAQNAHAPGSLRSPSDFAPRGLRPPGVPAGLFSPCGLKTHMLQVRFAHPPKCALALGLPPTAGAPEQVFRPAYFRPLGQTHGLQVRFAHPPNCAPRGLRPPGVPHGLFSPFGLKTHMLQVRWRSPSELRPVRARPARGSGRLIFARWAQNARPPGPLARTLRTSPRAGAARPGFRPVYFRPAGLKRTCSRFAPGGRGFLSGADVENRPKRGILKLM